MYVVLLPLLFCNKTFSHLTESNTLSELPVTTDPIFQTAKEKIVIVLHGCQFGYFDMAADLLEQQSAVLSVPWEYLRFFSMIGSSLIFPPFSSPLGRFSISFLHAAPIFLTTLWIMTHGFHVKAKMLVPFERETNPTFYHPDKCQGSLLSTLLAVLLCNMLHINH